MPTKPAIIIIDFSGCRRVYYVDNLTALPDPLRNALYHVSQFTKGIVTASDLEHAKDALNNIGQAYRTLEPYELDRTIPTFPVGQGMSDGNMQIIFVPVKMLTYS